MANKFFKQLKNCKFFLLNQLVALFTVGIVYLGIYSSYRRVPLLINFSTFYADFSTIINRLILILSESIPYLRTSVSLSKVAFSFAEVFVVILMIGMIAQMTLPVLAQEVYQMTTIVALKRSFANSSNAFNMAMANSGTPDTWGLGKAGDATGLSNINEILSQNFRIAKNCGTGPGCFTESSYKNLKGLTNFTNLNEDTNYTKFLLQDGTSIAVTQTSEDCSTNWGPTLALEHVCGMFVVDVNGSKIPNTYGKDVFGFAFTKYGLVPLGTQMQTNYPFNGFCSMNSNANKTYENGLSCTAWVMYNENMEYEDCTGLNWKGKTQCKGK